MFKNFEEILRSSISENWLKAVDTINEKAQGDQKSDKVINHTKMEDLIYKEKRKDAEETFGDTTLKEIESMGKEKLKSFSALTQDIFNSFYNLTPTMKADEELSLTASKFNKTIMEKTLSNDEYQVLKQLTEGRDLESYEATKEFLQNIYNNLDELLKDISGEKKTLDVMENINNQVEKLQQELQELIEQHKSLSDKGMANEAKAIEGKAVATANNLESKSKQLAYLVKIVDDNKVKNKEKISFLISEAIDKSVEKVEEIKDVVNAWGTESAEHMGMETKKELVDRVKNNERFKAMTKIIGKYREIASQEMKNSYTYGRGERFDIELGNDLNRTISSEFANLAMPETRAMFIKKFQSKNLKQYRKRDRKKKGCGNMVLCADESGSTKGGKDFWCKALGLALLDVTIRNGKNFAYVHFANETVTNEINRSNYSVDLAMDIGSLFLGGGTNFEKALNEAVRLLEKDEYQYADLVFVTDGECNVSEEFLKTFLKSKARKKFKVIGVLLDKGSGSVTDSTLKKFCDRIYKTSEMIEDDIAKNIIKSAV